MTPESLDASWTSFVNRWNTEPGFAEVVDGRETDRRQRALGPLREEVCRLLWDQERTSCLVHHLEGCPSCREYGRSRLNADAWNGVIARQPFTEEERFCIGRYRRALSEFIHAAETPAPRPHARTPPQYPECPRGVWREAPLYPPMAGTQASELDNAWRGATERCDSWGPT